MKPQCEKCKRRGMLDNGLCAICYFNKHKKWSNKFIMNEDKYNLAMKFNKVKQRNKKKRKKKKK